MVAVSVEGYRKVNYKSSGEIISHQTADTLKGHSN